MQRLPEFATAYPPLPADKVTKLLIQARRSLGGAASDYGLRSALERIHSGA